MQSKRQTFLFLITLTAVLVLLGPVDCAQRGASNTSNIKDPKAFIDNANAELLKASLSANQAGWVGDTFITEDTEAINARAQQEFNDLLKGFAVQAAQVDGQKAEPDIKRQLDLLKVSLVLAPPSDPGESEELSKIGAGLSAAYGKGKWCAEPDKPDTCMDIEKITEIMAESRDPKRLREVWEGWQTVGAPMRQNYSRFVELANKGAKDLGFADTGAMWRMKYDMPPDDFTKELDRLWEQVRPLYVSLHAYVRMKLHEKYGEAVPATGPMPAHLLGNIWAQDWSNVSDLVLPKAAGTGFSLTKILEARKYDPVKMTKTGEGFFTSLGFAPLPPTFWERSMLTKPRDRDVVCHASAWNINAVDDVRIKMCIDPTEEDFTTIHHELGHNFYYLAYNQLPFIFRDSANDGFHEAIGDTVALSVTPEYLVKLGLLDKAPDASGDLGLLMSRALEKVAFLPFGLLIDQWRWQVFSGQVKPDQYNKAWWDLRLKYQGVAPPSARGEEFFDPGAKYHVPANTPYTRYFLAAILQFQFHRALAEAAGCKAPLHRCSIYESKEAGARLQAMLAMGASKPWPDALQALTGKRDMDATAIIDYFAPLKAYLDEQLKGKQTGW